MIRPEFLAERYGEKFVIYAGLLDLGHAQGLRVIHTELLQVPSENNGQTPYVSAEVDTQRGRFGAIGAASPANSTRATLPCTIGLVETRHGPRFAMRSTLGCGSEGIRRRR